MIQYLVTRSLDRRRGQGTLGDQMETRAQRVRDHLRRRIRENLTNENRRTPHTVFGQTACFGVCIIVSLDNGDLFIGAVIGPEEGFSFQGATGAGTGWSVNGSRTATAGSVGFYAEGALGADGVTSGVSVAPGGEAGCAVGATYTWKAF